MVLACAPGVKVVNGESGRVTWHLEEVERNVFGQLLMFIPLCRKKILLLLLQFHQMARFAIIVWCVCTCVHVVLYGHTTFRICNVPKDMYNYNNVK